MRWNTRSAPERSTRTATPEYFASNDLAIFSATARSIDVYQTTLPSFRAAAISSGVTASAAGAAATTRVANAAFAARAEEDLRKVRRDMLMMRAPLATHSSNSENLAVLRLDLVARL